MKEFLSSEIIEPNRKIKVLTRSRKQYPENDTVEEVSKTDENKSYVVVIDKLKRNKKIVSIFKTWKH